MVHLLMLIVSPKLYESEILQNTHFGQTFPEQPCFFSDIKFYNEENLSEIGDIDDFSDFNGSLYKAVKPKYG